MSRWGMREVETDLAGMEGADGSALLKMIRMFWGRMLLCIMGDGRTDDGAATSSSGPFIFFTDGIIIGIKKKHIWPQITRQQEEEDTQTL